MSHRRASYRPYRPLTSDALAIACYGTRRRRRPRLKLPSQPPVTLTFGDTEVAVIAVSVVVGALLGIRVFEAFGGRF